jgi:hypothetical protein
MGCWYWNPSSSNLAVDIWPNGTVSIASSDLQVHAPLVKPSISTSIGNFLKLLQKNAIGCGYFDPLLISISLV